MLHWLSGYLQGSNLEALSALAIGIGLLISRFLKGFREGKKEKDAAQAQDQNSLKDDKQPCFDEKQYSDIEIDRIYRQLAELEIIAVRMERKLARLQRSVANGHRELQAMLRNFPGRTEN